MAFNSESKAHTKTSYMDSMIAPLTQLIDSQLLTRSPNTFESVAKPVTSLPEVVESHLQQPFHNGFVFENMGIFEPTPIGYENHQPVPSLDINLLQDILNAAESGQQVIDFNTNDSSSNTKRKSSSSSSCPQSPSKKRRTGDDAPNFRPYQETKWTQQYKELVKFKEQFGHCIIPQSYKPNLGLSRWIKRQRYQYKLLSQGKVSSMTESRIEKLERVGFVWDSHAATWHQRFEELKEFRSSHGHCDVPSTSASNQALATWVKCQRRQYRLFFQDNALSSITPKRILDLEKAGFKWRVRDVSEEYCPLLSSF